MKGWFSENKKILTLIGVICLLVIITAWVVLGIISGNIIATLKMFFSIIAVNYQ